VKIAKVSGLLIRIPAGASPALRASALRSLTAAGVGFEMDFLFSTSPPPLSNKGLGVSSSGGWEWHVMRPKANVAGANPWELAHAAMANQFGAVANVETFIEPDLEQEWIYENPTVRGLMAAPDNVCVFNDQIATLPGLRGHFAWHLNSDFSQLKDARDSLGGSNQQPIRIAHLDTGYDAGHKVFPQHVRLDLQRNFMDDQPSNDAHDPAARGFLKNPGHGTGTLSILAGNRFLFSVSGYAAFDDFVGGAPNTEIIPVRVGKSVVQILTSSIAAGISYAADLCADESSRVHAMSMSMGGVASQAWADAVNKAYEAGIVYVAAAGNNYSAGLFGVPTRFIVYPARFRRVIAACGVMEDFKPYYDLPVGTMQGNWGPDSKMTTAMSAFTPNMPWAELGCAGIVDMDGQGTLQRLRLPQQLRYICRSTKKLCSIPQNIRKHGCALKQFVMHCSLARTNRPTAGARSD
jgi:subtilisin family serine protease